jgi:hypothetical protein
MKLKVDRESHFSRRLWVKANVQYGVADAVGGSSSLAAARGACGTILVGLVSAPDGEQYGKATLEYLDQTQVSILRHITIEPFEPTIAGALAWTAVNKCYTMAEYRSVPWRKIS